MLNLFNQYSLEEIIIFVILLLFALKELFQLKDFFSGRMQLAVEKQQIMDKYDKVIQEVITKIDNIEDRLKLLTESDKDDIKSWLIERRDFYRQNPDIPVSTYMMDTIEKRYCIYKQEGGNSFVDEIMTELRDRAKGGKA